MEFIFDLHKMTLIAPMVAATIAATLRR